MNDPLLFELVSQELDIKSVGALACSHSALLLTFERVSKSNDWWFTRVQLLLSSSLEGEQSDNWKNLHAILHKAIEPSVTFTTEVLSSVMCARLWLADDRVSSFECNEALVAACATDRMDLLPLLLSHPKLDASTSSFGHPFFVACKQGHIDVVRTLLEDERVAPRHTSCGGALTEACVNNRVEVVRLLLQDGRIDPSWHEFYCLPSTCREGHIEIVRLLLEDGRADPSYPEYAAVLSAHEQGHQEIVDLLVADPRVGQAGLEAVRARLKK